VKKVGEKQEIRVSGSYRGDAVFFAANRSLTTQISGYGELSFTTQESASKAEEGSMLRMIIECLFDPKNDDLGVTHVVAARRKMGIYVNRASDKAKLAKTVGDVLRTRYTVVNVPEIAEDDKADKE
jgi:molybdate-binding protein